MKDIFFSVIGSGDVFMEEMVAHFVPVAVALESLHALKSLKSFIHL
jgi:hypothetical protein